MGTFITRPDDGLTNQDVGIRAARQPLSERSAGKGTVCKLFIDPYESLMSDELGFIGVNISKHHVVGHNLSMVDGVYKDAATTESLGETVSLAAEVVERIANLCRPGGSTRHRELQGVSAGCEV